MIGLYNTTVDSGLNRYLDSLWQCENIWQKSGWTLVEIMTCCLTAPSHYLNQCWLLICGAQYHSLDGNYKRDVSAINHYNKFETCISKITLTSSRVHWVKQVPNPVKPFMSPTLPHWPTIRDTVNGTWCEQFTGGGTRLRLIAVYMRNLYNRNLERDLCRDLSDCPLGDGTIRWMLGSGVYAVTELFSTAASWGNFFL